MSVCRYCGSRNTTGADPKDRQCQACGHGFSDSEPLRKLDQSVAARLAGRSFFADREHVRDAARARLLTLLRADHNADSTEAKADAATLRHLRGNG